MRFCKPAVQKNAPGQMKATLPNCLTQTVRQVAFISVGVLERGMCDFGKKISTQSAQKLLGKAGGKILEHTARISPTMGTQEPPLATPSPFFPFNIIKGVSGLSGSRSFCVVKTTRIPHFAIGSPGDPQWIPTGSPCFHNTRIPYFYIGFLAFHSRSLLDALSLHCSSDVGTCP